MLTEADVRDALRVCFDPELAVNIVDLGLVEAVRVAIDTDAPGHDPRYLVDVSLTMRSRNEEREAMLLGQVSNRLGGMEDVSRSHVYVVAEPAWTAERMTDAARAQLGLDRARKQGLVNIQTSR